MRGAAVLGAGIQGVCTALMLSRHGYRVSLIDRGGSIFSGASLNQEGKVHLGFVYGMDTTLETGKKMILDAFTFGDYVEYLLGEKIRWVGLKSKPFHYLVHRDSFLRPDEVEEYYARLQEFASGLAASSGLGYLGESPDTLYLPGVLHKALNGAVFDGCFSTREVSIDQNLLKALFWAKLERQAGIRIFFNHQVLSVGRKPNGFDIDCIDARGLPVRIEEEQVFNCLWDGRTAIDRTVGLTDEDRQPSSMRFKFGIGMSDTACAVLQDLQSFTIVQGAFGDFVSFPATGRKYFCWYPCSMKGMTNDISLPEEWRGWCDGKIPTDLRNELVDANYRAYKEMIPALPPFDKVLIRGGVIVAPGARDITDKASRLHSRNTNPITHDNGYFSIDTGKFTSAPRNTKRLEKLIT